MWDRFSCTWFSESVFLKKQYEWEVREAKLQKGKDWAWIKSVVVQLLGHVWLCNPMDCSTPSFPVLHHLPVLKLISIELVMPSKHLTLCCPLLLLPSIFPSIRFFSNESTLRIRWPKYWRFNFSISPSNNYSGLISFRMDWLDLLAVQGLSTVFSNTTIQKYQFFNAHLSLWSNSHIHMITGKIIALMR